MTLTSAGTLTAPTDFIVDVRDGLVIPSQHTRIIKKGFQEWLTKDLSGIVTTGISAPIYYTRQGSVILYTPKPSQNLAATLWYYALPNILDQNDKPDFPDDWTLVEYVRLRGMEHIKALPPGSSTQFVTQAIGTLKAAGLLGEPENDTIPLDPTQYMRASSSPFDWMGSTTVP